MKSHKQFTNHSIWSSTTQEHNVDVMNNANFQLKESLFILEHFIGEFNINIPYKENKRKRFSIKNIKY